MMKITIDDPDNNKLRLMDLGIGTHFGFTKDLERGMKIIYVLSYNTKKVIDIANGNMFNRSPGLDEQEVTVFNLNVVATKVKRLSNES